MAINKKLIHFNRFSVFKEKRLSANTNNDSYYKIESPETIVSGSPDLKYQSIVFIKDTKQIWTHGRLYDCSLESLGELKNLETTDKSTLVDAINEVLEDVAALSNVLESTQTKIGTESLNSGAGNSLVDAVNSLYQNMPSSYDDTTLKNRIRDVEVDVSDIQGKIGTATLTTSAQTLTGAINEVRSEIPDFDTSELENQISGLTTRVTDLETSDTTQNTLILGLGVSVTGSASEGYDIKQGTTTVGSISGLKALSEVEAVDKNTGGNVDIPSTFTDSPASVVSVYTELANTEKAWNTIFDTRVGDTEDLDTSATDLVGAVNELSGKIDSLELGSSDSESNLTALENRIIVLEGNKVYLTQEDYLSLKAQGKILPNVEYNIYEVE